MRLVRGISEGGGHGGPPPCFNYHILEEIRASEGVWNIYLENFLNIYRRR